MLHSGIADFYQGHHFLALWNAREGVCAKTTQSKVKMDSLNVKEKDLSSQLTKTVV